MKKIIIKSLLVFSLLITLTLGMFLSGCSSAKNPESTAGNPIAQEVQSSTQVAQSTTQEVQPKFDAPDLMGEVVSVSEKELELKVIEMPQRPQTQQNIPQPPSNPEEKQNSQPTAQDEDKDPNQRPKPEFKYTGETKKLTISDNVIITARRPVKEDQSNANQNFISLEDIKPGDIVEVWFGKDGSSVERISLR